MKNPQPVNALSTGKAHLAESSATKHLRSLLTTDVMAKRELPNDLGEIDSLRSAIDAKIYLDFVTTRLSDAERESITKSGDRFSPSVLGKFDSYLLDVAQQYGARLLLSLLAIQRLWSWQCGEKDGSRKLKALFHEIHRSALIGTGKKSGRINGRHRTAKPFWVQEITGLQMRLREAFPLSPDAVRQFVDDTVEASPESFDLPHL